MITHLHYINSYSANQLQVNYNDERMVENDDLQLCCIVTEWLDKYLLDRFNNQQMDLLVFQFWMVKNAKKITRLLSENHLSGSFAFTIERKRKLRPPPSWSACFVLCHGETNVSTCPDTPWFEPKYSRFIEIHPMFAETQQQNFKKFSPSPCWWMLTHPH